MPVDWSRYPTDWKAISLRIRERDGQRCKWCGVANRAIGARDRYDVWHDEDSIHGMNSDHGYSLFGDFPRMIKIVLTVAHIDRDPSNNADDNLASLCQRCHLRHDAQQHATNAAQTRRRQRVEAGQMELNIEL